MNKCWHYYFLAFTHVYMYYFIYVDILLCYNIEMDYFINVAMCYFKILLIY